jgi:RNA polymerase sigma-70 factor (ECF subfamily)
MMIEAERSASMLESETMKMERRQQLLFEKEQWFVEIRPRLLRLARQNGVAPDALEDVVQETLLVAWRQFERLYSPDQFHAWLDGICRNICARALRAHHKNILRHISLFDPSVHAQLDALEETLVANSLEAETLDPAEMLSRNELIELLRQALGLLPDQAREAVELYYLLEIPQREAASRLGLSISAMEARLHRARLQLRQILNGDLRADAVSFGLLLDDEPSLGWQATSLWCYYCGRQHLHGTFETSPDGQRSLRLRCPDCSRHFGGDIVNGKGLVRLDRLRSFRSAFKRTLHGVSHQMMQAVAAGETVCGKCGKAVPIQVGSNSKREDGAVPDLAIRRQFWVRGFCLNCGSKAAGFSADDVVFWATPIIQQFIQRHPRWLSEPDVPVEYEGQPAIHFRLSDCMSAAKMDVIAHRETLQSLAIF